MATCGHGLHRSSLVKKSLPGHTDTQANPSDCSTWTPKLVGNDSILVLGS